MKFIFCLDDRNGMMFNGRRQSQDRVLRDRIMAMVDNSTLFMSKYSANQFFDYSNIKISDNYQKKAKMNDYCFIEDRPFFIDDKVEEIIIYRWNRHYPADTYFNINLSEMGYSLSSTNEFEGSSHERITEEKYKKQ